MVNCVVNAKIKIILSHTMYKTQTKSVEIILKLMISTLFLVRVARFELAASRPQNAMLKIIN